MACKACVSRGQTWSGSAPKCAFEGEFSDNWNCATLNAIRNIVYEGQNPMPPCVDYQYCDDMKYSTVYVDNIELPSGGAMALWVAWYKNRGATDAMWLLSSYSDQPPRIPTEADCLAICAAFGVNTEASE